MNTGITSETMAGIVISLRIPTVVMLPAIQSIMVVTSPMGEGAPPAAQAVGMALAAAGTFLCAQAGSLARAERKLHDAGKRRDSE